MEVKALREVERDHLRVVLAQTSWDLEKAARLLEISLPFLKRKITEHGLREREKE
ncbi:MAG: helix-turn-helix domain-containing protein [Desulfobacteraceae bacterium]|jgi:DNA-binding NtrC family response regulator